MSVQTISTVSTPTSRYLAKAAELQVGDTVTVVESWTVFDPEGDMDWDFGPVRTGIVVANDGELMTVDCLDGATLFLSPATARSYDTRYEVR